MLEPLCFPEHSSKANFSIPLFCLLCDKMFKDVGVAKSDALLHHLLVEHQFVIADVDLIADFKRYYTITCVLLVHKPTPRHLV